jgi:formylglycine-generating enzyme required for sulfatase activity
MCWIGLAGCLCGVLSAEEVAPEVSVVPSIEITNVAQRWPWNNKVDISYTVSNGGEDVAAGVYRKVVFTATINGQEQTIDGSSVGASAQDGPHTVVWYAPRGLEPTTFSLKAALFEADAPSGDDYMIVDLATGAVTYEGMVSQDAANERYNTATYKTTKMAFRKVPRGTYQIGLDKSHAMYKDFGTLVSSLHNQTLSRDYYMAIFECTIAQWKTIFGADYNSAVFCEKDYNGETDSNGDNGQHRAAHKVSWNMVRGATSLPTDLLKPNAKGTVMERLNAKTEAFSGLQGFDLPTEVMFEVACRAGQNTFFFWGDDVNDYADYVVCKESGKAWAGTVLGRPRAVGSKKPNGWGFYDISGNVWEWCLDDTSRGDLATVSADAFTPASNGTDGYRRMHGGGPYNNDILESNKRQFACAFRNTLGRGDVSRTRGFRVAWIRW